MKLRFCLVVWLVLGSAAVSAQEKNVELPKDAIAAWEQAGAQTGWMGPHRQSRLLVFSPKREQLDAAQAVPAFAIARWREGMLGNLPMPEQVFGLFLQRSGITDEGLKELAGLNHLTSIDLGDTTVTDAELKTLGGMKQLRSLGLFNTRVTDAGLKELAGQQQLSLLSLGGTRVTYAGLKEIARLKQLSSLSLVFTHVTDMGLRELAGLKELTAINLAYTGTALSEKILASGSR